MFPLLASAAIGAIGSGISAYGNTGQPKQISLKGLCAKGHSNKGLIQAI